MKKCTKCGETKGLLEFYKRKSAKDGLRHECKKCSNIGNTAASKRYREKNPRERKESVSRYNAKPEVKAKKAIHRKMACQRDPSIREKDRAKYRERIRQATPAGVAPFGLINEAYKLSRKLTEKTGIQYSVDHIIPLKGKAVSGLNVPWNIQIIPLELNLVKSNKLTTEVGYRS